MKNKKEATSRHLVSHALHPQHNEILNTMDDFYKATGKFLFNDFNKDDIEKVKKYRESNPK